MMHQIFSALVSFFVSPIDWIIILLCLSFLTRSASVKKRYRLGALVIFLLFSNTWLLNGYARFWQPGPRDITSDSSFSCGILLGGFGNPDEQDHGYFNSASDRFIQTVKLLRLGKIRHILITGGNGKNSNIDFNEGKWTRDELITLGVADSAILFEDRSSNTEENARNSALLLGAAKLPPPYLLITSAHHMPRAQLLFKQAGLATSAFPCGYMAGRDKFSFWGIVPKLDVLNKWDYYMKETASYIIYKIRG